MNLHKKLISISLVAWALIMATVASLSYFVILADYKKMEQENINTYYVRTQEAISRTIESLSTLLVDWAHWNDTYQFLKDKNKKYIEENIYNLTTFNDIKLNFLLFYDDQSKYFYGNAYDFNKNVFVEVPKSLLTYIEKNKILTKHDNVDVHQAGFIYLPEGFVIIAAYPTTNGEATAPPNGTIMMGYYLSAPRIEQLSKTLQLYLALISLDQVQQNPALQALVPDLEKSTQPYLAKLDDNTAHIYTFIKDINNNNIGLLQIDMPRKTYLEGVSTIYTYLIIMCIVGFIITALVIVLFKLLILNRITIFQKQLKDITSTKIFSKQINITGNDEITAMVKDSNKMLTVINETQQELSQSIDDLTISNRHLNDEIIERKKAEEKVAKLHSQLLVAARRAGMADIATSVLHNIGNVLNSANTSITLINENLMNSKAEELMDLVKILQENEQDLPAFFAQGTKAKDVANFITLLAEELKNEKNNFIKDIDLLDKNIQHIKNIITMQQTVSGTLGVTEKVAVTELIENALIINKAPPETPIEIKRDYKAIKPVISDQVKLLQIIVNLIKNAIESLIESDTVPRRLEIKLNEKDDTHFMIQISDNGVGIPEENLLKIFTHGFTTKKNGHGFGLHTTVLSVQEMGGELLVESDGVGKGATFTLILPYELVGEKYVGELQADFDS